MAYETKADLSTDKTIKLGGVDEKGRPNPTSIEGYFLGTKETESDFGPGKLHIFQTADGNVGVWGKSRMNGLLTSNHIGQMCLLTFTGMGKPSKGRKPPYLYKLQFDKDNTIDVSGIDVNAAVVEDDVDYGSYDNEEETPADEVPPTRAVAPKRAAATPSASSQARTQALLNGRRQA